MNLMAATEAEEGERNQIQEFCDWHLSNGPMEIFYFWLMVWNWWVINVHHGHSQPHLNCVLTSGAPDFGVCWNLLIKPVLNWANVCSPNILQTLQRTMICFLIELLVRWTWFGQSDELYFVLNWLVMRCNFRPELSADTQQTAWSKM